MMKNTHKERPVRNFFYAVFCILSAFAFIGVWLTILFPAVVYRKEIMIASIAVLALAVIFGIIIPMLKLIKKR